LDNEVEDVRRYFDQGASDFEAIYSGEKSAISRKLDEVFRKSMKIRFDLTLKECQPCEGKRILDLGCGSGVYSIELAKMGAHVFGIDFAENMLKIASNRAMEIGVENRCQFVCDDFILHNFDEKFDISIAMGVFDYVKGPQTMLSKMHDVTNEKVLISFPVRWHILTPLRKLRLSIKNCPVFFYNKVDIERLLRISGYKASNITKIGRDYFVAAFV
jgi:magnesium protoporphyrin O-methyltransferase